MQNLVLFKMQDTEINIDAPRNLGIVLNEFFMR